MTATAVDAVRALGPIQRAYLVGDQPGLELRSPARYYLPCDVDPERVPAIAERLRDLARDHAILRASVGADLELTVRPPEAADQLTVDIHTTTDDEFPDTCDVIRREFTDDAYEFDSWPQLRLTIIRSPLRARLHLIYALWMMDAAALEVFLAALVAPDPPQAADAPPAPRRDRAERDERYWRARADTLPGPAELPLRPDWRHAGRKVGHRTVVFEAAAGRQISNIAAEHGLTPAAVYLAAYGAILSRLGGGVEHTVTVLHSTRPYGAPAAIGNFGTTVPVDIPAPGASSFAGLARAVQARSLSHAVHGSLGGARIARLADPDGAPDRLPHPFAFTAFVTHTQTEADRGLRRCWDEVQLRVPQVLLDHQAALDADGTVRLSFDWRTDAFDPGFAEDFVECCSGLIRALAQGTEAWEAPLSDVLRASELPYPTPKTPVPRETLHERVLRSAAEHPDRPAVRDDDEVLTYAELVARASASAALLRAAGAGSGDRIAVHLPRSVGQAVAELGILMAGCVFVPIDVATPPGRIEAIARRAAIRLAFTADAHQWTHLGARPLTLPTSTPKLAAHTEPAEPAQPVEPATTCPIAYVIFTSGSTGEPKGVVISHAAVLATLDAVNAEFGVGPDDSVLSVSSIGFDLSVYDVFGPLLRGGSAVMLSEESGRSPVGWVERIQRHGVTLWNSAPALAGLLAQEGAAVPSIRRFLLSGDWIALTLPERLQRLAPAAEVISLGGATEGAVWSIFHRIASSDLTGRSIPYGRPLAGQDVLVLDATLRQCPDWHIGELYIAGAGVADGYENDPERTAAAFLSHPDYGRIYRTGDRGRRLPGGVIEFLGRTDTQVKLNGHRVELGEIESVLCDVAGVHRCAVVVRPADRGVRLAAFVVLEPEAPTHWRTTADAALRDALPSYMVPDVIVELDDLPLTASGKLDQRRLATMPLPDTADESDHVSQDQGSALGSEDPYAHEVAACWNAVLGRPPGHRGFFEDGGSSYDAIRLLSLLRSGYGHDVSYGRFMAEPTATGLARRCREQPHSDGGIWVLTPRPAMAPQLRLVLFPPVGGAVACYAELVRRLRESTAAHLIGFDGPAIAPDAGFALTLADLAERCLAELSDQALIADADAPLVFAGWSFGGALAFEAARLCPVPVTRVVVIDTPPPASAASPPHLSATEEPTLAGFLGDIRHTNGIELDPERALSDPVLAARFAVYRQNLSLLNAWDPRSSDIPVHHLRATDTPAPNEAAHWSRIAPVARSGVLAGGHFDVFADANLPTVIHAIEGVRL